MRNDKGQQMNTDTGRRERGKGNKTLWQCGRPEEIK